MNRSLVASSPLRKTGLSAALAVGLAIGLTACSDAEPEAPLPARVPVTTETIERAPFRASIDLFGRVEPSSRTPVQAPAPGRLKYPARFGSGLRTGEWVENGTPLFELHDEDAELRLVEARLEHLSQIKELERIRRSVEAGVLGAVELERQELLTELSSERLANAELHRAELVVTAPVSGHLIVDQPIAPGTAVTAGAVMAEIAGTGAPRVNGLVAASDLGRLRTGLTVEALSADGRTALGRGRISEVARQIDADGAARLVATIDQNLGMPAPGEGLLLRVLLAETENALSVPSESVLVETGVALVFVLEPSGGALRARRRIVQLGERDQERVEVIDGLNAGEMVAVRGVELLGDGVAAVDATEVIYDERRFLPDFSGSEEDSAPEDSAPEDGASEDGAPEDDTSENAGR